MRRALLVCVACLACLLLAAVPAAFAVSPAPGWNVSVLPLPSVFSSADNAACATHEHGDVSAQCDGYQVTARDAGAQAAGCSREALESELLVHANPVLCPPSSPVQAAPITLTDVLPKGLHVEDAILTWVGEPQEFAQFIRETLEHACETTTVEEVSTVRCTFPSAELQPVRPDRQSLVMTIFVSVQGASGLVHNRASVSGGGAPAVSGESENEVGGAAAPFGVAGFDFGIDAPDGSRDSRAGGHPYELLTTLRLNTVIRSGPTDTLLKPVSVQDPRDIFVDLPLGFAASTLSAPQCTLAELSSPERCPRETQVGEISTTPLGEIVAVESPIWNMVPDRGFPAEFGYLDAEKGAHVFYAHVAPTPEGYVLQAGATEIPQADLTEINVIYFGDPAVKDGTSNAQVPYFTNPTHCSGSGVTARVLMDSWQHPGSYNSDGTPNTSDPAWVSAVSVSPPVTGCEGLQFGPSLLAQPTTSSADSPSGLEFELKVPQPESFNTTSTPALDNATVTFPEGVTVDPSSGSGLAACSPVQIGWLGGSPENFDAAPPACPEASKIGSLELESPLIPRTLTGAIYLAAQDENPFGSVFATYVVVNDPVTGVVLKIAGELKSAPRTGRLTAFFPENAQLPFSDLKLHFFGGPRAELATPESCGTFTTTSVFEPWSFPDSGPSAEPFSDFTINEGCVGGFDPSFTGGSTNLQAGAFTSFVASFSRQDIDQEMGGLSVTLPPGLLADVGSVAQCSEADVRAVEAGTGGCPEDTRVGTVTAGAGPGPDPLFVTGKAYLTGPHNGGPFGLAVVVPAVAGPFRLGNVVVRQSLRIDQRTAQVTDVSDPFPTFLDPVGSNGQGAGIPIKLRRVDVSIDRPGFTFNPTSCEHLQVTGAVTSTLGAGVNVSSPFQVTNCGSLSFKPVFKVQTSASTSRTEGASLHVTLTLPNGARGTLANVAKVRVSLPKQLPSPLKTLQKACLEKVFDANPASCPAASRVGEARVSTPILEGPLTGPAIFVSHGGARYPELIIVLTGENGVTAQVHGETLISKGITTATFATVPDVPFSTFELTLPKRDYPALTANGNLCKGALIMPTEMVGQNGLAIEQSTRISVSGCGKPVRRERTKKHHHKKKSKKK